MSNFRRGGILLRSPARNSPAIAWGRRVAPGRGRSLGAFVVSRCRWSLGVFLGGALVVCQWCLGGVSVVSWWLIAIKTENFLGNLVFWWCLHGVSVMSW
jgi:hypothetical protein